MTRCHSGAAPARRPRGTLALLLTAFVVVAGLAVPWSATAVDYPGPPEDYAPYQPQKRCTEHPRPGTVELAAWLDRRYDGGPAAATMRACGDGGVSEHKDGRAVDWTMRAGRRADRQEVKRFLRRVFATDGDGNEHALARRMGIMYVIWNDHMYASYRQFRRTDYLSSSCRNVRTCSPTLRHRDHVHISLSRPGGRGETSWYVARGVSSG